MANTTPTAEEVTTYASGADSGPPDLRFLHYNDVYHVDPSSAEPVGGAPRFQTLANHYRSDSKYAGQPELVTFFSGDAFNPSLESSVTKGSHMVPILNNLGTNVACVGNHDLDFGVQQYRHLVKQCRFPWLLANVLDPALGENEPLGNAKKTVMLTSSNGIKIGVIGLAEREWLDTINSLPPDIIYKSASATAKELVPGLRAQGAEIIVAVTHQREPNDNKLAEKTDGIIDIILGGHDHYYNHSFINGTHVLRSGSDFKQLSYIEARRKQDGSGKWNFIIKRRDAVSSVTEDKPTLAIVEKLTASLKTKMEKPIGYTAAPLDARFTTVRTQESNIGNFICDIMRSHYQADCSLMAAGTIRGDQIYPPGILRLKDILHCFPFEDPVVVLEVTGKALLEALENSVSLYPALEGRFPQVSEIEMEFDPHRPSGSRITSAKVAGKPLDLERKYILATRGYMGRGKDGYDSLLIEEEGGNAREIVSEENGILISMMLRQYFMSLKVMGKWKRWGPSMGRHWNNVQRRMSCMPPGSAESLGAQSDKIAGRTTPLGRRPEGAETPLADSDSEDDSTQGEANSMAAIHQEHELLIIRKVMRKWRRLAGLDGSPGLCDPLNEGEFEVNWTKAIAPRLEGRITIVGGGLSPTAKP